MIPILGINIGKTILSFSTLSLLVLHEDLESINKVRAVEWVATDADAKGLAKAGRGRLGDGLIGEGAGAGDDSNLAGLVDVAGHDANLALAGADDTGAVGADQSGLLLLEESGLDLVGT